MEGKAVPRRLKDSSQKALSGQRRKICMETGLWTSGPAAVLAVTVSFPVTRCQCEWTAQTQ